MSSLKKSPGEMMEKLVKEWKKVLESDLKYVVSELREEFAVPAVIFLEGKVGSGKTTFCRHFTEGATLSPTYSIISETDKIIHADFYRLESAEEILHLELGLYLDGKDFFLAEWGMKYINQLINYIPDHFQMYRLDFTTCESSPGVQDCRNIRLSTVNPLL
jgi:tRNA threonylcarbamoyladenosine biosynthesis protein TsaE